MQYLGLVVICAVVVGYICALVFSALKNTAALIGDGISRELSSSRAKRAERAAQIERSNAEARADAESAELREFREANPVKIIGIPNAEAFDRAFKTFDNFTRAANACRPRFRGLLDARFKYERFPSETFFLRRPHPESLSPAEPTKIALTADDVSMSSGQQLGTLYDMANTDYSFPPEKPEIYTEDFTVPSLPQVAVPPRIPARLVTLDNTDIDDRSDYLRRAYEPEFSRLAILNAQKQDLLGEFDSKHSQAVEALELMNNFLTNLELTIRDAQAGLDASYEQCKAAWEHQRDAAIRPIRNTYRRYLARDALGVQAHFTLVLSALRLPLPDNFEWSVFYDPDDRVLQVNQCVPAIADIVIKRSDSNRPPAKRDAEAVLRRFVPAIALQVAHQVAVNDLKDNVDTIAVNCWCRFFEPSSGKIRDAFVASLTAAKEDVIDLVLERADPLEAFRALRGSFVFSVQDVMPIEPTIRLDKSDDRFVAGRAVLDGMAQGQNLSTMDWQDFEHLIRELFAKEFSSASSEVKVTRASRDRGVDAVVFNSDPLHGGRIVIQAKRYTNTVDVAAVRELFGTVQSEGANRGILVTTSQYGRDAYEWASNKPLTLIDGPNLLSLLSKHGYNFMIESNKS
jgi:restriction system protein